MTRTKKSPTPSPAKTIGAEPQVATPKEATVAECIAVPVVDLDADATATPEQREAGSALAWLCQGDRPDDVTNLAMDGRTELAARVAKALGPAGDDDGVTASVLTDLVIRDLIARLTPEKVLAAIRSRPRLAVGTRRFLAMCEAARG